MVIAHNVSALNTYKSLGIASGAADKSMEKLSSGYRINRAGDDAAGLSISEKMRSQIRGLNRASRNAQDGISMIQTAEGALNEEHSILQRMREIAVQSASDTNQDLDRAALQNEMAQLTSEINRIGNTTEFNGMKLLNGDKDIEYTNGTKATAKVTFSALSATDAAKITKGLEVTIEGTTWVVDNDATASATTVNLTQKEASEYAAVASKAFTGGIAGVASTNFEATAGVAPEVSKDDSVYFHVGANSNQTISTEFGDMRAKALGLVSTEAGTAGFSSTKNVTDGLTTTAGEFSLDITTRTGANSAIDVIDNAINKVSQERSKYGAIQNRLEYTINNLNTSAENMQAAESRIRDVDMADEMMELTKNNILQQAAQAMLVQANQRPQSALQLLQ